MLFRSMTLCNCCKSVMEEEANERCLICYEFVCLKCYLHGVCKNHIDLIPGNVLSELSQIDLKEKERADKWGKLIKRMLVLSFAFMFILFGLSVIDMPYLLDYSANLTWLLIVAFTLPIPIVILYNLNYDHPSHTQKEKSALLARYRKAWLKDTFVKHTCNMAIEPKWECQNCGHQNSLKTEFCVQCMKRKDFIKMKHVKGKIGRSSCRVRV